MQRMSGLKASKPKEVRNLMHCESPYNKWINQTALGRHDPCTLWVYALGQSKGRAGDAPGRPSRPALRPCSLVIHVLYGLKIRDRKLRKAKK